MERIDRYFKALSDETRLTIVGLVFRHGQLCVCEVQQILGITQSKASRHLRYLRDAGILEAERDGDRIARAGASGHFIDAVTRAASSGPRRRTTYWNASSSSLARGKRIRTPARAMASTPRDSAAATASFSAAVICRKRAS